MQRHSITPHEQLGNVLTAPPLCPHYYLQVHAGGTTDEGVKLLFCTAHSYVITRGSTLMQPLYPLHQRGQQMEVGRY